MRLMLWSVDYIQSETFIPYILLFCFFIFFCSKVVFFIGSAAKYSRKLCKDTLLKEMLLFHLEVFLSLKR